VLLGRHFGDDVVEDEFFGHGCGWGGGERRGQWWWWWCRNYEVGWLYASYRELLYLWATVTSRPWVFHHGNQATAFPHTRHDELTINDQNRGRGSRWRAPRQADSSRFITVLIEVAVELQPEETPIDHTRLCSAGPAHEQERSLAWACVDNLTMVCRLFLPTMMVLH
jgi:hypothetical protein